MIMQQMDEQVGYEPQCFPTNNFYGTGQDKVIVKVFNHRKDLKLNIEKPKIVIRFLKKDEI